jgi:hypothetical protein
VREVRPAEVGITSIGRALFEWTDEITTDCWRKQAKNLDVICGARCPDLPKVV